ncbi:MAG: hypothetical protein R2991_15330 [Thermoanaerobaculia bacterium]
MDWDPAPDEDLRAPLALLLRIRRERGRAVETLDLAAPEASAWRLESGAVLLANGTAQAVGAEAFAGRVVLFDSGESLAVGTTFDGSVPSRSAVVVAAAD